MEPIHSLLPLSAEPPACDDRTAELYRYWRDIWPAADRLPGRQHLDPLAIPRLLPWLRLYDVQRDPLRFKYRLVGTEAVRMLGRDPTGHWIDETFPNVLVSKTYEGLVGVANGGFIGYRCGAPPTILVGHDNSDSEFILLPLARDGRAIDMMVALTVPLSVESIVEIIPVEA
jgi:hypothetical protein